MKNKMPEALTKKDKKSKEEKPIGKAPKPAFKMNKAAPVMGSIKNVGHKPIPSMPVSTDRGNFKIK